MALSKALTEDELIHLSAQFNLLESKDGCFSFKTALVKLSKAAMIGLQYGGPNYRAVKTDFATLFLGYVVVWFIFAFLKKVVTIMANHKYGLVGRWIFIKSARMISVKRAQLSGPKHSNV